MRLRTQADPAGGKRLGLSILVVGLLAGLLIQGLFQAGLAHLRPVARNIVAPARLEGFLHPREQAAPDAANGLETLRVTVDMTAAATLQDVRNDAINRGMIIQDEDDTVKGEVHIGEGGGVADIRIKGDWTDHVDTDKWSLRIKLKDTKLNGMAVFSVQHPKTRGMLWEWLVLSAARREGLLAPRSSFVNVELNGNPMGIYYLEEHFSKELLESQGRREGPIVLWDESTRWASLLQARNVPTKGVALPVPSSSSRIWSASPAFVRAYGEKRLSSIDSLSRSLYSAVEKMEALQAMDKVPSFNEQSLARILARERIQGETIDTLVDTGKLSRMHALCSLFQVEHPLIWHNMRFYHDPVLNRLEPILFDCNAHEPSSREVVVFRARDIDKQFGQSQDYYNGVFQALGELCGPEYLEELLAELGDELELYETALAAEFDLTGSHSVSGMLQRLRTQQAYLGTAIAPVDGVNFHAACSVESEEGTGTVSGTLFVDAWTTTRAPVVLEAFEFSNGTRLAARGAEIASGEVLTGTLDGGVVLPNDGRPVRFRFPMDSRIANLENVDQVLTAMRTQTEASSIDLKVSAVFRPIALEESEIESLTVRAYDPDWDVQEGRPKPPSLEEALAAHEFLEVRPETGELWIRSGTWKVTGDLVVPSGLTLHANGARLLFESDSLLLTDAPLQFQSVTLEPQAAFDRWRGVVVLQARGRSHWSNVTVRATDSVARAGWNVTGGITFYRSPVTMLDSHIDGTWAEDGTNVFGADCLFERTTFSACVSDSFDGDFITGVFRDCVFQDGLADGVDVSGSDVDVIDCKFLNMGDKGISAGENSIVRVDGGLCDGVSLGIAAKDRSQVDAKGMTIRGARNYALTAFVKKAEFGPAHMVADGLLIEGSGLGDYLVQTDCTLVVDGISIEAVDLDVKQLYKDKVLGQ